LRNGKKIFFYKPAIQRRDWQRNPNDDSQEIFQVRITPGIPPSFSVGKLRVYGKPDGYDLNWRHCGFNIFCEEFPGAFGW